MRHFRWTTLAPIALIAALLATGCGGGGGEKKGGETEKIRVGLVTDTNGLNDRSFNHLAFVGITRAEKQLGIEKRVLVSNSNADYVPNLSSLAQQHYDLVIGVGFLLEGAIGTIAKQFPKTKFAIIDDSVKAPKIGGLKNVQGLLFTEQEGGYLVGYVAALQAKAEGGKQVIGTVGGQKIPPVDRYIAGFQAGAKAANPGIRTLNAYSQDFNDPAKCKEIALNEIAQGAHAVMNVAGLCGLGALDAAKEKHVWGIGADADQSFLGPHILVSALKKVDVAVYDTVKSVKDGAFKGGSDRVFDTASNGVGLGSISPRVSKSIVTRAKAIEKKLAAHQIKNIPTTVK